MLEGDRESVKKGLWLTIILGAIFTCVQAYEYSHATFAFKGNIYGATFFMATGFHGVHVLIGTIFLIVCLFRVYAGQFTPKQHLGFEFAAWYWHFVDVVWIFLFACHLCLGLRRARRRSRRRALERFRAEGYRFAGRKNASNQLLRYELMTFEKGGFGRLFLCRCHCRT